MMRTRRCLFLRIRLWVALSLLIGAALIGACQRGKEEGTGKGGGMAARPPVPVLVAVVESADVPVEVKALGTAEAVQSSPVRVQVGGALAAVAFREGDEVAQGQVLFRIDPRPFEASLRQILGNLAREQSQIRGAEALVKSAEAQAANAEAQATRYDELARKDFVTREQYEQRQTNRDAARATLAAARASLDAARAAAESTRAAIDHAKLQLGYTVVRSPLAGRTGSLLVKTGDLVRTGDVAPLVLVNQMDPIRVRFALPARFLPDLHKAAEGEPVRVRVDLPGGGGSREGGLAFVDNAVNPRTATIDLKAEFANADQAIWPGQFLDVAVVLSTRRGAVVVPVQAVQTGQKGPYLYVVEKTESVAIRPVVPGLAVAGRMVIEDGVVPGEIVVVDGQLRLGPGAKIIVKDGFAVGGGTGGEKRPAGTNTGLQAKETGR